MEAVKSSRSILVELGWEIIRTKYIPDGDGQKVEVIAQGKNRWTAYRARAETIEAAIDHLAGYAERQARGEVKE